MREEKAIIFESTKGRKYEIVAYLDIVYDSDYGADADGHRGMAMEWVDDVNISHIRSLRTNNMIDYKRISLDYMQKIYDIFYEE